MRITLTLALAFLAAEAAWAQVGSVLPYNRPSINPRPTVSPYVRLRDGGGAITYYGQIRPQMQNTRDIQSLQQSFSTLGQEPGSTYGMPQDALLMPTTGHPVRFFSNSYFFSRVGGVGFGTGGGYGGGIGGFGPGGGIGAGAYAPASGTGITGIIR